MRGQGLIHVVKENIAARKSLNKLNKWMNGRPKCCWKCQKDKPRKGGLEKIMDGFGGRIRKFICKDCLDAKEKAQNAKTQTT